MGNHEYRSLLFFLLIAFTFFSCSVYTPVLPHAPLLSEKKQFQANVNLQNIGGINGNLAYSFTNHLAVLANGSLKFNGKKTHSAFDHYQNFEIGVGYFTKIRKSDNWVFEAYGGCGLGNSEYKSPDAFYLIKAQVNEVRYFKADNNIVFGQIAFGFKGGKNIMNMETGFGLRANSVNFQDVKINNEIQDNVNNAFLLPFVFYRVGSGNLRTQIEYSYSFNPFGSKPHYNFTTTNFNLGVGLVYNCNFKK